MGSTTNRIWVSILMFISVILGANSVSVIEYEQIQHGATLDGIAPILVTSAISVVHCATLCEGDDTCRAFSCDCALPTFTRTSGECNLYDSYVTSPSQLTGSRLCYVQKKIAGINWGSATTTTIAPPSPTSSTTSAAITTTTTTTTAPVTTTTTPVTTTTVPATTTTVPITTTTVPVTTTTTTTTTTVPVTTTTVPVTTTITVPVTTTTTTTVPVTTTTVPVTTTTTVPLTTTTSIASTIRGIVEGDFRMCSGSSARDFVLLQDSGVFVYEDRDSLATGPCTGPIDLGTMFPGYDSLPPVSDIECVLRYQSDVEMYAAGYVYVWQASGGSFNKIVSTSRTYSTFLGGTADTMMGTKKIQWCALRQKNNVERHFYMEDGTFILVDSQAGTYSYAQSSEIRHNGFNMNPWSDIPTDVIAVGGYTSQPMINFILIDSALTVFSYALNHSPDNNNPTKTVTEEGALAL